MRLTTFNILHGRSTADGAVDLGRFASAVARLDADVLALQEVDRDQPRSHSADLTALAAEALGAVDHRFVATLAGTPDVWTAATGDLQPATASYGIALLSRHPVLSWRTVALPPMRGAIPMVFPGRDDLVRVLDEPRVALCALVQGPAGPLTVIATHLTFIPGWNGVQLRHLARHVATLPRPLVLMGDLNLAGTRPTRILGWPGLAEGLTFPVHRPNRQLDHILGDGPIRPKGAAHAVDTGVSDHRALVVDVEYEPAPEPGPHDEEPALRADAP